MTDETGDTGMNLKNMTIYSIFVRNHGGTFEAVRRDVARIRSLGVDTIWLLPIHPIGKAQRKGTLGSPYASSDYRAVNPEYGTLEDFKRLADEIHSQGMKLMIDVVFHHTSPDSVLVRQHPEWFYRKEDGSFGNHVGDWSDVIDLDFDREGLSAYLIDTLKMWAHIVDGFRCDVAPMVPLNFWLDARWAVEEVRPGCIWLAESVEPGFVRYNRNHGIVCHSDAEMYQAFDICYDYDVYDDYRRYLKGEEPLDAYIAALERQECIYPDNYVKLRNLENHDRPRAAFMIPDEKARRNWLVFNFLQKGAALLYDGQEWEPVHRPGLFDADPVRMEGEAPLSALIRRLTALKKEEIFSEGVYSLQALPNDWVKICYQRGEEKLLAFVSLQGKNGLLNADLPEGTYRDLLTGRDILVEEGLISSPGEPVVLRIG